VTNNRKNKSELTAELGPQGGPLTETYFQTMLEGACIIEMLFEENGRLMITGSRKPTPPSKGKQGGAMRRVS